MLATIFLGHGSPMNAVQQNSFTTKWLEAIADVPKPRAILIISAHWETTGTKINGSLEHETFHDFSSTFPVELFEVKYPAIGDPELAQALANRFGFEVDNSRGLDHGVWSVLRQMYPKADVPVLQLSLDETKSAQEHFELGQSLSCLRDEGVLIIGSGTIVHNIKLMDWKNETQSTWAIEFNDIVVKDIVARNVTCLINYEQYGELAKKGIPTPEHYLPLLYALGASNLEDKIEIFNSVEIFKAATMTCVKFAK